MYDVIGKTTTRTFRVLWALEELGQPYTHQQDGPHSDAVAALSASGKVPIFRDGDDVITDSAAILTYLADKHGALTYPAGTIDRARLDAFTHRILDEVDALLWTAARHSFVLPEEHRVPAIKAPLKWEYARNIDRLMQDCEGPFLMGEAFTIPDILLAHCGGWAMKAEFPADNPDFAAYLKRARARPAFKRALATA
ncbi:glutathione S-transferase [Salinihabitans flavidus]|uniref:Glutathione S-transferase n=1 Tax=Salinihabitans flavidus TaxID=569882 RepID=A0A1H8T591_9RHOB|nr:glutathione S-transferase family protein [Salinihabitans flavidus]SEO86127.1 glutathione S-transferase [Salinihabitans flavidus]